MDDATFIRRMTLFLLGVFSLVMGGFLIWWYWFDIVAQYHQSWLWWQINTNKVILSANNAMHVLVCGIIFLLVGGFVWTHILFPSKRGTTIHGMHYEDFWSDR